MRKYFWSLLVVAPFVATAVYGLPAPSSLSSREKHAVAPRATPTPVAQRRAVAVSEADRPSTVVVIDAGHGGFERARTKWVAHAQLPVRGQGAKIRHIDEAIIVKVATGPDV